MEEFEYKLSRKNPVLILNTIKAITDKIRSYNASGNKNEFEKHYRYLREKCLDKDICISTTAIDGLLSLCDEKRPLVKVEVLVNDFMAATMHSENVTSVIYLVYHAIKNIDFSRYGIMNNQHPLITILKRNPTVWPLLLTKITKLLESPDRSLMNKKLNPFVLYVLYDYDLKVTELFQQELLKLYIESSSILFYNKIIIFFEPHLVRTVRYCKILLETNPAYISSLILCIDNMLKYNLEPSEAILALKRFIKEAPENDLSGELILLTSCIATSPLVYLTDLLEICEDIIKKHNYPNIIINTLKTSVISWKFQFPTYNNQTTEVITHIDALLTLQPETQSTNKKPLNLQHDFLLDLRLYIVWEILQINVDESSINALDEVPAETLLYFFEYLLGVLFTDDRQEVLLAVINQLNRCTERYHSKTARVLPVLLCKLANCTNPNIQLLLLKTLPKMAVLKENLAVITTTLKALSGGSSDLQTLALSIFFELCWVESRCFCYLQELLVKDTKENYYENVILKAYILKELCRKGFKLEVYAKEITEYISKILSGSKNSNNSIPQALAIEGLRYLCNKDHVDIASAWSSLSPQYEKEERPLVVKNLCYLLSEVSNDMPGPKYDRLRDEVVRKLWDYTTNTNAIIVEAAYNSLSHFNLEQISSGLPEYLLSGSIISVFGSVHGKCWINVLKHCKTDHLQHAGNMLKKFIATEIRSYHTGVYEAKSGEPTTLELPVHSMLAAIVNFVKGVASSWKSQEHMYLECLRIISYKYSRPIPPIDWCFLQELIHEPELREYCVMLASNQVILSGSARRLIENYIVALNEQNEFTNDVLYIYKCLPHICNSIQPTIMKPFIENTLKLAILQYIKECEDSKKNLDTIMSNLIVVLENKNLSESNKQVVAQALTYELENLDHNVKAFDVLLACVHILPLKNFYDLSSPKKFESLNERMVERCLKIQCWAAKNSTEDPLSRLDKFISCNNLKLHLKNETDSNITFDVLLKWLRIVFLQHRNNPSCVRWLIDLMAKIQLELADKNDIKAVMSMCAVFIIAVCVLSGFHIFKKDSITFSEFSTSFPYAVVVLCRSDLWSGYTTQILEWLYDMAKNKIYKKSTDCDFLIHTFKSSLLCMRNEEPFNLNCRWMKFLEINVH